MDVTSFNKAAWDNEVATDNPWTQPVASDVIAAAQRGDWSVWLTDTTPTPATWFPPIVGCDVLCLASGGGQQGPILAAAGANVTVFDNSPRQLAQDRKVAERDGLTLRTIEGDMADLSSFAEASFDLVFHPVSNCFVPDVRPVWQEAYRVLRPGGTLLSGFINPDMYMFDSLQAEQGVFEVKYKLPFVTGQSITEAEHKSMFGELAPLEFSHSLDTQIGGQLAAGFSLIGFYEDRRTDGDPLSAYMPSYMATRALKPA